MKVDVCLVEVDRCRSRGDMILLVVQESKWVEFEEGIEDVEAKLVAGAIAAFSLNNTLRRDGGLPELQSEVRIIYHRIPFPY